MKNAQVGIVMGSYNDYPVMKEAEGVLKKFGIPYESTVSSAHRHPEKTVIFAKTAWEKGIKVIIAGAGMAAHLAGVIASHTIVPVIGVPLAGSSFQGMDALLSTVQMPQGVPVATVAVGGAANAAYLALEILALNDAELRAKLLEYKEELKKGVEEKDKLLHEKEKGG
jgi:phosphoribosylaminoimidazole carboxylase PurE protein